MEHEPVSQKPLKLPRHIWGITLAVFTVMLVVFIPVYQFEPFNSDFWNYNAIYILDLVAALFAAGYGTILVRQFAPGEPPRRVWLTFVLGWWAWALGELLWIIYGLIVPEFPDFTIMDICWTAGYFLFGLSIYYQQRLIAGKQRKSYRYFIAVAVVLLVGMGLTLLAQKAGLGEGIHWSILYLSILYPVTDIAEGGFALKLSLLFGRGRMGRPWWGLIAFAVADAINIFFWMGGYDLFPEKVGNLLYLLSDTCYICGYMIVALGFLSILLLQQGKPAKQQPAA